MELVKLTIDGQEVQVPAGTTVLEEHGTIFRLCMTDTTAVGACRLCVVETRACFRHPV